MTLAGLIGAMRKQGLKVQLKPFAAFHAFVQLGHRDGLGVKHKSSCLANTGFGEISST